MVSPWTQEQVRLEWVRRKGHLNLSFNVAREVCKYPKSCLRLYEIMPTGVKVFDIERLAWSSVLPLSEEVDWDVNSRYALLSPERVFCCGGDTTCDYSNRAFVIEVTDRSAIVTGLSRMRERRSLAGVVYADGAVYVFGGYGRPRLKSAETNSLCSNWESLDATMHSGRSQFNPCYLHARRVVYLAGGNNVTIETFHLETRQFALVPAELPILSETLTWVQDDQLCVLSLKHFSTLSLKSGELRSTLPIVGCTRPRAAPIFVAPFLYWLQEGGHCFQMCFNGQSVVSTQLD